MIKNKKIVRVFLLMIISILFISIYCKYDKYGNNSSSNVEQKELPLKVENIPVSFNIIQEEGNFVLESFYKNNSKQKINKMDIEFILKDTNETINISYNEVVNPEKKSSKLKMKAPVSGKIEDIEIIKYKISLDNGVYMEYDMKLNQYNWS